MYRLKKIFRRLILILAAVTMLCGLVFLFTLWQSGRLALGPCTPGYEGAAEHVSGGAKELLETRNFEASPKAVEVLMAGIVDERLVFTLQAITEEHRVCVDAFKKGRYFLPGVPDGPLIPDGYPDAGLSNTRYFTDGLSIYAE